ncbi:MAG: hypothetical protein QM687_01590 [Ferruginibacter sp.]
MEEQKDTSFETLFAKAGDYLETRIDLVKLKTTRTTSDIVSSILSKAIVGLCVIIFLVMINIGVAIWIGRAIGETYYGFFIVGGFYGLVALLFHWFRRDWIKTPVSNKIIKKMTRL